MLVLVAEGDVIDVNEDLVGALLDPDHARHVALNASDACLPPMGLRLRLKSSVDISSCPGRPRIVAEAMRRYGVILAR